MNDQTEIKVKAEQGDDLVEHPDEKGKEKLYKGKDVPLEKLPKEDLLKRIEEFEKTAEENYDLYVRSQAEMENIKKRFQKEKESLAKFSNEILLKQMLPVVDNLEKAIVHSEDGNSIEAIREGIELTLKTLRDTLDKSGVSPVISVKKPFDPNFHEAIASLEDEKSEPGTVIEEIQKGYILNDRLIRPAKVIVSKGRSEEE